VIDLHLCDVDDIDHHISSLQNVLPHLPNSNEDQIHVKPPYTEPPLSKNEQHLIHPYPDTVEHLLSFTDGHSNGPQHPTSQGLNLYDPYGEDLLDLAAIAKSPTMPGLTIVKDGSAFKPKLHG